MKKDLSIISLIFFTLCICSDCPVFAEEIIFTHKTAGFSIQVPNNWIIEFPPGKGSNAPAVVATTPDGGSSDQFLENINVNIGNWYEAVDESQLRLAHKRGQSRLKQIAKEFKEEAKGEAKVGGMLAIWSITTFTVPDSPTQVKQLSYMIAHKNKKIIFSVICTALPTTFSDYEQTFIEIVNSFRLSGE